MIVFTLKRIVHEFVENKDSDPDTATIFGWETVKLIKLGSLPWLQEIRCKLFHQMIIFIHKE